MAGVAVGMGGLHAPPVATLFARSTEVEPFRLPLRTLTRAPLVVPWRLVTHAAVPRASRAARSGLENHLQGDMCIRESREQEGEGESGGAPTTPTPTTTAAATTTTTTTTTAGNRISHRFCALRPPCSSESDRQVPLRAGRLTAGQVRLLQLLQLSQLLQQHPRTSYFLTSEKRSRL
jgi:hypothetical protein